MYVLNKYLYRDIITIGDAMYRMGDHTEWLQGRYGHNEPRWWEALTNQNPPSGALTLRRGHMLITNSRTEIYEFMGVSRSPSQNID